jgi:pimeloyl-ACP methyl ester carboxylesterase
VTIPGTVVEAMAAAFEADFPGTMEGFVRSAFPAGSDPGTIDFAVEEAQKADPAVAVALLRDFPNLRLAELLNAADAPVRCINAGTNPTATEINRRYGDFEAVILPGAGHFLMLERPAEFNTALSAVLESLKGSPESSH